MRIIVAKRAGFCFGVKRAIDIAFKLAESTSTGVYTFGPLIHNPQVIDTLSNEGVKATEDIHLGSIKTLILRTHGVSPGVYEEISKEGYELVDATCPFVKKAQKHVKTLKNEGYQVLILGDREHPEVRALMGYAGDDAFVITDNEPLPDLKARVGLIVQTTQPVEALRKTVSQIAGSVRELKVYNTICDSTTLRLEETDELARKVNLLIVVGGKNSANTTQLTKLSQSICGKVFHIETAGELDPEWFSGVNSVGITGGASTPQWIIDGVVKKIKEISERR